MLDSLEKRTGSKAGATVVVDRGMPMRKIWPRFGRVDFTILWRAGSRNEMRGSESSSRATTGKR